MLVKCAISPSNVFSSAPGNRTFCIRTEQKQNPLLFWCAHAVSKLADAGIEHIVHWSEEQPGSQLIAVHFGKAFVAALRNSCVTVPEVIFITMAVTIIITAVSARMAPPCLSANTLKSWVQLFPNDLFCLGGRGLVILCRGLQSRLT